MVLNFASVVSRRPSIQGRGGFIRRWWIMAGAPSHILPLSSAPKGQTSSPRSSLSFASCSFSTAIATDMGALRRKRSRPSQVQDPISHRIPAKEATNTQMTTKMGTPYAHGEENMDEYLAKMTLSPWVPLPDSAARKIFDLTRSNSETVHVDLGSGDGRVNFHAIDHGKVKRSTGIDVDPNILKLANERLAKRHPRPNIEFIEADLLDENHPVWPVVQEADLITMYFADEALSIFRPVLEKKLAGKQCKIVTAGYEMPGWDYLIQEVVLGMKLTLYEFGSESQQDIVVGEDILHTSSKAKPQDTFSNSHFSNSNVIDRTNLHPVQGFNIDILNEVDDDDWEEGDDDDSDEE